MSVVTLAAAVTAAAIVIVLVAFLLGRRRGAPNSALSSQYDTREIQLYLKHELSVLISRLDVLIDEQHRTRADQQHSLSQLNELVSRLNSAVTELAIVGRRQSQMHDVEDNIQSLSRLSNRVSSSDLESLCRRFLELCDKQSIGASAAKQFFATAGARANTLEGDGEAWRLLSVHVGSSGLVVPVMRQPMGQVPLSEFFELMNYNGLDPLRPSSVSRLPRLATEGGKSTVIEKGYIDGR